ncbi:MAG: efflux RND transporter periplasmic adaptor subunit, partial [Acidobacteria bacterium]|nr:efflux RND transporter periplasmic adaptor subunit [Acidobacteriota bacterium]
MRKYALVLLTLLSLVANGCSEGQGNAGNGGGRGGRGLGGRGGGGPREALEIKAVKVERVSFQRQVDLSGTLIAPDQVRVVSEVPGQIQEVRFELGSEVRAGDVLVRLDTRELELALQRAESALRQTEAQLGMQPGSNAIPPDEQIASVRTAIANRDDARAQLQRAEELVSKGLLPKAELDTTTTRVKVTEANHQAAIENVRALKASLQDRRASYELAQKKLADAVIRAPISGSISERPIRRGEFIRDNTHVATIVQMHPLKLVTAAQEKYADVVRQGLTVQFAVESLPGETFKGRVAFISPAVDQATRTFPVEVLVDNPSRKLKPGFFTKGVILTRKDENVMALDEIAVSIMAGVSSVYLVGPDGAVSQRNIRIGAKEGKYIEILEGLRGDEIIAASNLNELVSGLQVTTQFSTGTEREAGPATAESNGEIAPGGEQPRSRGGRGRGGRGR